jgi:hypothetical protein
VLVGVDDVSLAVTTMTTDRDQRDAARCMAHPAGRG